ncbi:MAG: ArsR family transcriptional regulator, partial [Paracoccaceae bacterium]|nr:ArsR family transcriptional regulator [Paracoccaceae bacterium]
AALGLKQNTLSVYLAALEQAGLIASRRAGRAIFYRIDLGRTGGLIDYLLADCCRGRPDLCAPQTARHLFHATPKEQAMPQRPYNVLFVCSGNSARSIMAEAILATEGQGKFRAYSAGTQARSALNPFTLDLLTRNGHDVSALRAKTITEFQTPDAPALDFVFTVCDTAANEECTPWAGAPLTAHWGLPDPVKATGTKAEVALAFARTYSALRRRILAFVALPFSGLEMLALQQRLDDLGQPEADR